MNISVSVCFSFPLFFSFITLHLIPFLSLIFFLLVFLSTNHMKVLLTCKIIIRYIPSQFHISNKLMQTEGASKLPSIQIDPDNKESNTSLSHNLQFTPKNLQLDQSSSFCLCFECVITDTEYFIPCSIHQTLLLVTRCIFCKK